MTVFRCYQYEYYRADKISDKKQIHANKFTHSVKCKKVTPTDTIIYSVQNVKSIKKVNKEITAIK